MSPILSAHSWRAWCSDRCQKQSDGKTDRKAKGLLMLAMAGQDVPSSISQSDHNGYYQNFLESKFKLSKWKSNHVAMKRKSTTILEHELRKVTCSDDCLDKQQRKSGYDSGLEKWQQGSVNDNGLEKWQRGSGNDNGLEKWQRGSGYDSGLEKWHQGSGNDSGLEKWQRGSGNDNGLEKWQRGSGNDSGLEKWQRGSGNDSGLEKWQRGSVNDSGLEKWQRGSVNDSGLEKWQRGSVNDSGLEKWQRGSGNDSGLEKWQRGSVNDSGLEKWQRGSVNDSGLEKWQRGNGNDNGLEKWQRGSGYDNGPQKQQLGSGYEKGLEKWQRGNGNDNGLEKWQRGSGYDNGPQKLQLGSGYEKGLDKWQLGSLNGNGLKRCQKIENRNGLENQQLRVGHRNYSINKQHLKSTCMYEQDQQQEHNIDLSLHSGKDFLNVIRPSSGIISSVTERHTTCMYTPQFPYANSAFARREMLHENQVRNTGPVNFDPRIQNLPLLHQNGMSSHYVPDKSDENPNPTRGNSNGVHHLNTDAVKLRHQPKHPNARPYSQLNHPYRRPPSSNHGFKPHRAPIYMPLVNQRIQVPSWCPVPWANSFSTSQFHSQHERSINSNQKYQAEAQIKQYPRTLDIGQPNKTPNVSAAGYSSIMLPEEDTYKYTHKQLTVHEHMINTDKKPADEHQTSPVTVEIALQRTRAKLQQLRELKNQSSGNYERCNSLGQIQIINVVSLKPYLGEIDKMELMSSNDNLNTTSSCNTDACKSRNSLVDTMPNESGQCFSDFSSDANSLSSVGSCATSDNVATHSNSHFAENLTMQNNDVATLNSSHLTGNLITQNSDVATPNSSHLTGNLITQNIDVATPNSSHLTGNLITQNNDVATPNSSHLTGNLITQSNDVATLNSSHLTGNLITQINDVATPNSSHLTGNLTMQKNNVATPNSSHLTGNFITRTDNVATHSNSHFAENLTMQNNDVATLNSSHLTGNLITQNNDVATPNSSHLTGNLIMQNNDVATPNSSHLTGNFITQNNDVATPNRSHLTGNLITQSNDVATCDSSHLTGNLITQNNDVATPNSSHLIGNFITQNNDVATCDSSHLTGNLITQNNDVATPNSSHLTGNLITQSNDVATCDSSHLTGNLTMQKNNVATPNSSHLTGNLITQTNDVATCDSRFSDLGQNAKLNTRDFKPFEQLPIKKEFIEVTGSSDNKNNESMDILITNIVSCEMVPAEFTVKEKLNYESYIKTHGQESLSDESLITVSSPLHMTNEKCNNKVEPKEMSHLANSDETFNEIRAVQITEEEFSKIGSVEDSTERNLFANPGETFSEIKAVHITEEEFNRMGSVHPVCDGLELNVLNSDKCSKENSTSPAQGHFEEFGQLTVRMNFIEQFDGKSEMPVLTPELSVFNCKYDTSVDSTDMPILECEMLDSVGSSNTTSLVEPHGSKLVLDGPSVVSTTGKEESNIVEASMVGESSQESSHKVDAGPATLQYMNCETKHNSPLQGVSTGTCLAIEPCESAQHSDNDCTNKSSDLEIAATCHEQHRFKDVTVTDYNHNLSNKDTVLVLSVEESNSQKPSMDKSHSYVKDFPSKQEFMKSFVVQDLSKLNRTESVAEYLSSGKNNSILPLLHFPISTHVKWKKISVLNKMHILPCILYGNQTYCLQKLIIDVFFSYVASNPHNLFNLFVKCLKIHEGIYAEGSQAIYCELLPASYRKHKDVINVGDVEQHALLLSHLCNPNTCIPRCLRNFEIPSIERGGIIMMPTLLVKQTAFPEVKVRTFRASLHGLGVLERSMSLHEQQYLQAVACSNVGTKLVPLLDVLIHFDELTAM
uniref:Uncharacterized protein LOC102802053 n=1 Tax=Saccoglossus kowalevskii TaxID=10224 RepID=A0ABM0M5C6_SACKO|nr:PREDICTED: uncharacterized protein LOC102802053 [Saccoglossus kowalevskii]